MKVEIQLKIGKDMKRISDEYVLKSFYKFIELCTQSNDLKDISQIKKITWSKSHYRYRIRDYRVGMRYDNDILFIERILHRKDIYKVFP